MQCSFALPDFLCRERNMQHSKFLLRTRSHLRFRGCAFSNVIPCLHHHRRLAEAVRRGTNLDIRGAPHHRRIISLCLLRGYYCCSRDAMRWSESGRKVRCFCGCHSGHCLTDQFSCIDHKKKSLSRYSLGTPVLKKNQT